MEVVLVLSVNVYCMLCLKQSSFFTPKLEYRTNIIHVNVISSPSNNNTLNILLFRLSCIQLTRQADYTSILVVGAVVSSCIILTV